MELNTKVNLAFSIELEIAVIIFSKIRIKFTFIIPLTNASVFIEQKYQKPHF